MALDLYQNAPQGPGGLWIMMKKITIIKINYDKSRKSRLVNGFIITWILLQKIIMYSNKVKLAAGKNDDPPHTTLYLIFSPTYCINKLAS